jgi:hypothetical protein
MPLAKFGEDVNLEVVFRFEDPGESFHRSIACSAIGGR